MAHPARMKRDSFERFDLYKLIDNVSHYYFTKPEFT